MAIDAQVALAVATVAIELRSPVSIIDDEQIQPAIIVVVEPAGSDRPLVARDSRLLGHVLEFSVAQIAIENVAIDAGHEQIRMPVIVVVSSGRAHRIARTRETRL